MNEINRIQTKFEVTDTKFEVTDSSKTIDPTGNRNSSESNTSIVAEMVAILGDQVVGIPSVLCCKLLHHTPHLFRSHLRLPHQNRPPKPKSLAPPRFSFEYPRRRILVSSECVLHSMNCTENSISSLTNSRSVSIIMIDDSVTWVIAEKLNWYSYQLS